MSLTTLNSRVKIFYLIYIENPYVILAILLISTNLLLYLLILSKSSSIPFKNIYIKVK
ncbi:hypothetical protein Stok01_02045 [Sulfurisphaera tokodaii]